MKRELAARYLTRIVLYGFCTVIFLLLLWLYIKGQPRLYDYYAILLMILFRAALVSATLSALSLMFSLYDVIIARQLRALSSMIFTFLSALVSAFIGAYAGILQAIY